MQVLLVAIGSHGDVLPFIALGVELRRRGHPVVLAAPALFEAAATRVGLQFHALVDQAAYDTVINEPDLWHPRRGVRVLFDFAASFIEPVYSFLAAYAAKGEVVVVASILSLGARIAQERLGLRVVTVHLAPFLVPSRHAPPQLPGLPLPLWLPALLRDRIQVGADRFVIDPGSLPPLNAYGDHLGLPPVPRLRSWWNSPLRIILMFPEWFAARQADWPPQSLQTGFPHADGFGDVGELSKVLRQFLQADEAPLVFTYGSAMRQGQWFFDTAVSICARMGRRGILLSPQQDQVPSELPADVIHLSYAPLSQLLPHCAALIHHGGIGTVAQALAAGVPQVIVPVAFDHFDEAVRIERLGVGESLSRGRFTPSHAVRCLDRLLTSKRIAAACEKARYQMSQDVDGVMAASDDIEQLMRL